MNQLVKFLNEKSFVAHTGFDTKSTLTESHFDTFFKRLRFVRAEQERLQKLGLERVECDLNSKITNTNFDRNLTGTIKNYINIINNEFGGDISTNKPYVAQQSKLAKFLNDKLFVYRTGFDTRSYLTESHFDTFFERLRAEQEDEQLRFVTEQNLYKLEKVRIERERAEQLEPERAEQERLQKLEQKRAERLKQKREREHAMNRMISNKNFDKRSIPTGTIKNYINIINNEFGGDIPTNKPVASSHI